MSRTLDHWVCPECSNSFQTVGLIDPDPLCRQCGHEMACYACDDWGTGCCCLKEAREERYEKGADDAGVE